MFTCYYHLHDLGETFRYPTILPAIYAREVKRRFTVRGTIGFHFYKSFSHIYIMRCIEYMHRLKFLNFLLREILTYDGSSFSLSKMKVLYFLDQMGCGHRIARLVVLFRLKRDLIISNANLL